MLWLCGYYNDGVVAAFSGGSICDPKSTGTFDTIQWKKHLLFKIICYLNILFIQMQMFAAHFFYMVEFLFLHLRLHWIILEKEEQLLESPRKRESSMYFLEALHMSDDSLLIIGLTVVPHCRYAKEILQKEMLPHVGTGEFCETKKAYYFG